MLFLDLAYFCQFIFGRFCIDLGFQNYLAKLQDIFTSWEFLRKLTLNSFSLVIFKPFVKNFFLINYIVANLVKI